MAVERSFNGVTVMREMFLQVYPPVYRVERDDENLIIEMALVHSKGHISEEKGRKVYLLDVIYVFRGNYDRSLGQKGRNVHLVDQKAA